jgi:hypothetical protein
MRQFTKSTDENGNPAIEEVGGGSVTLRPEGGESEAPVIQQGEIDIPDLSQSQMDSTLSAAFDQPFDGAPMVQLRTDVAWHQQFNVQIEAYDITAYGFSVVVKNNIAGGLTGAKVMWQAIGKLA